MSTTPALGRWPVILSGRAIRELRVLAKDKRTFDIVQTKLKELSYGQFSLDNHLVIQGSGEHIPVHRARLSNDLRVIYQIDVMSDTQNQFDRQVIKVFSVSSRARVDYNFWVKVSKYLAQQGGEYRARCVHRLVSPNTEGSVFLPASFPHQDYDFMVATTDSAIDEANLNELHETLVQVLIYMPPFKFDLQIFPGSRNLHRLPNHFIIVRYLYSHDVCFSVSNAYFSIAILADMEAVLPMALNTDERAIVRHQGTTVVIGRSGTGKTTALIYKLRANAQLPAVSGDEKSIRQLFVTRSRVLTQHIASNYRGLVESSEIAYKTPEELAEMRKNNEKYRERELVEFDNEVDLRDDLPERFGDLKDSHFPLFVSFEKLCSLLEADLSDDPDTLQSTQLQTRSLITFSDFKRRYWPTFDSKLIKNMDPGLVFSEILGVIKGSGEDLSKEEYLSDLSHKKSPLLLNVRGQVYGIFEAYLRQSRLWNEIDTADRTRKILREHAKLPGKLPASKVDYIFVDEVQDHLMVDVHLLQSLCSNPDGGYWCGDTAQTISVGSSFRIKELKAFIYEKMYAEQNSVQKRRKAPAPFETFELSVNFRSHGGIVRYAASIVELIYTLFPNAIDHMEPETAKIPGKPPRMFVGTTEDHWEFVHYLLDEKPINEASPFGAQQAIIVRSDSTAQSLTTRLQKRCTVLTLLETKGLEFDDIVVYNFFAESEAPTSAWRLVLGLTPRDESGRIRYDKSDLAPSISPVLCSELKQLYVAVTRARHRCWLWDSGDIVDLMQAFWSVFGLITVSDSLKGMGRFAASSADLRQWAHRGQELFANGLYEQAASCFERAEQDKEKGVAVAYHHMSQAKQLQSDRSAVDAAYIKAANEMVACAKISDSSHSASVLWYHAASCFEAARKVPRASWSYRMGALYDRAALVSFNAQDIDDCLLTLVPHYDGMEASLAERTMQACRVHYLRASNYGQLKKLFKGDHAACIDYTRSLGFSAQLKDLLKMSRQLEDLANVHLDEGSPIEAARCLLQSSQATYLGRVQEIILAYLWSNFGLDATPAKDSINQASQLIELYSSSDELSDPAMRQEIMLFTALLKRTPFSLDRLNGIFEGYGDNDTQNRHCLTLAYHNALKQNNWVSGNLSTTIQHLRAWYTYSSNIQEIAGLRSPAQDKSAQRLLGLSTPSSVSHSNAFHVPNSSVLYPSARKGRMRVDKTSRRENIVATNDLNRLIKQGLPERLRTRLTELHFDLFDSKWAQPSTALGGPIAASIRPAFSDQLHALGLVFAILDPVKNTHVGQISKDYNGVVENIWLAKMFNLIFPATGVCNNLLALSQLQGGHELKPTLCSWISEALKLLDPLEHHELYITKLVMYLSLAHEIQTPENLGKSVRPPPKGRSTVARGCTPRPDLFTAELDQFFQRGSPRRIMPLIDALQYNAIIDGAVLVHFIELITRETILAERYTASKRKTGFSGLVLPLSWARSLTIHASPYQYASDTGYLVKLLQHVENILRVLYSGVPAYWRSFDGNHSGHSSSSLATRLHWSLALVAVNLDPARNEQHIILDLLQQAKPALDFETSYGATNPRDSHPTFKFSEICDQRSALSVLFHTIQHEELVMLSDSYERACPAKRTMVHRVIEYRDMTDLRSQLNGFSVEPEHVPAPEPIPAQGQSQAPIAVPSAIIPQSTVDEAPVAAEVGSLPPAAILEAAPEAATEGTKPDLEQQEPALSKDEAVYRIQSFWRKCLTRRRLRDESQFDEEGACYELFRPFFLPLAKRKAERDRLVLWLVRGPCLSIVLALQSLVRELEEFVDDLNSRLHAPDLNPKDIAKLQKDIQRDQKLSQDYKKEAEALGKRVSTEWPPTDIKIKNLMHIKTLAKNARALFVNTRNAKILHDNETFEEADQLMLHAKNVILEPSKPFIYKPL
ncbi:hypothetical protein BDV93DRAFT_561252 [Ceratobasidium sp. AG-I]|nr:hypothetical protein BDV93DRAFT_561252 [Ceratobasidium sp. AG-I]